MPPAARTKRGKQTPSTSRPTKPIGRAAAAKSAANVTIDDVAKLAEVSPKTVSRVINDEPSVHAKTKQRVQEAIGRLNYRPNLNARGLASNRSFLIGLFCDKPGDYLSVFQAGAVERCRESGFHLMVEPFGGNQPDIAHQLDQLLGQLRLEGAILLPPLSDHPIVLAKLEESNVPTVRIAPRHRPEDSPWVGIDDYAAARRMTAHLVDLGHRRIGFVLGQPEHGASEARYQGFISEMRSRGLPVQDELIETGNFVFNDGLACAQRLLGLSSPPTAIFASNDDTAAAAIAVARRLGLRLPEDLSIAGFDDAPIATMITPELTTVRQPVAVMARIAANLIIEHAPRLRGWPSPVPNSLLDFSLLTRSSTAPPRVR